MRVAEELTRLWQGIRLFALISWFHLFKLAGNVIDRKDGKGLRAINGFSRRGPRRC